jgi:hypothetical protein
MAIVERQAGAAFPFRVGAGVEQQAVTFQIDEPGAGADVGVGVQIRDAHGSIETEKRG